MTGGQQSKLLVHTNDCGGIMQNPANSRRTDNREESQAENTSESQAEKNLRDKPKKEAKGTVQIYMEIFGSVS